MLVFALALFLFLIPFQFALSPVSGVDLPFGRVFAITLFFWWLAEAFMKRSLRLPPLLFTGAIFSFLAIALISLIWAENPNWTLRKAFFLFSFFPLIFVFYDLSSGLEKVYFWLRALIAGALLASLTSLTIFFSQFLFGLEPALHFLRGVILPFFLGENLGSAVAQYPSLLVNIGGETILRATGFFPDPHVASFYFGMTALIAFGLFFQEKKKWLLVASAILLITDVLTFSRGGYLGLLVGGATFLFLSWNIVGSRVQRAIIFTLPLILTIFFFFGQPVSSRFLSSFSLLDSSSTERIALWGTAIENIALRPLLGTGLGNYSLAISPITEYRTPYYAHNLYLDIAVELGLIGLFFFLLIIGIAYFNILKNMRIKKERSFLSLALLSSLTLYLTHSLFETALFSVHILPLLLFTLALAWYDDGKYAQ